MNKWQYLGNANKEFYNIHRMMIPGGWLIKLSSDVLTSYHDGYKPESGYEWRESITFVPDPNHEWEIKKEEQ